MSKATLRDYSANKVSTTYLYIKISTQSLLLLFSIRVSHIRNPSVRSVTYETTLFLFGSFPLG